MLTAKQEKFCRLIALESKTQYDAFLEAGYTYHPDRNIIDHNASMIARSNKILTRINELRDSLLAPELTTAIERRHILSQLERDKQEKTGARIAAIAEHNKMDHVYDDRQASIGTQYNIVISGDGKDLLDQLKTIDGKVTKTIPKVSDTLQLPPTRQDNTDSQAQDSIP